MDEAEEDSRDAARTEGAVGHSGVTGAAKGGGGQGRGDTQAVSG